MKDLPRALKQLAELCPDKFTKDGLNEIVSKLEEEERQAKADAYWFRVMEACRKSGIAPANAGPAFELVSEYRAMEAKLSQIATLCNTKVKESIVMIDPYWVQTSEVKAILASQHQHDAAPKPIAIFDVLVMCAGAHPSMADDFISSIERGTTEFRFQGSLGFGGKYWPEQNLVTCYPEDETEDRRRIIELTNRKLKSLPFA